MLLLLACTAAPTDDLDADSATPTDSGDSGDTVDTGEPAGLDDDDIQQAVENDLDRGYATAAQVAIWHEGEIVFSRAFGYRNPDSHEPVAITTLFQVGSDTKKMTAVALLQQVAAGRLSLDQTVASAGIEIANEPGWAEACTLRQLLSHQGGLYDYTPWDENPDDDYLSTHADGEFSEREWAQSPPGAAWNYSNPLFSLAGLATERADGRPWADVLEDDQLAPLGLARTFARQASVVADGDYAQGYGLQLGDYDPFEAWADIPFTLGTVSIDDTVDNAFTRPAGMVWSTAEQMASYGGFLVDGNDAVLDGSLLAELSTPQVRLYPTVDNQHYGLGLMVLDGFQLGRKYYDAPLWIHGGNTMSFTSTFYVLPEQRAAIAILSNGYGDDFGRTVIAAIEALDVLPEASDFPDWPTEETDYALLAGTYRDPAIGDIVVTDEGDNLGVSIPGLTERGYEVNDLLAYGGVTNLYYVEIDGYYWEFTFVADSDGVYRYVRDRRFVGTRVDEPSGPPRPAARTHHPGGQSPALLLRALDRPPWPVVGWDR